MDTIIKNFPSNDNSIKKNKDNKFGCFDMDYTLIKPKGEDYIFAKDKDDWKLLPNVKERLVDMNKKGWVIIVFTNQKGMLKRMTKDELNKKFNDIRKESNIPIYFMAALNDNWYRKPYLGMWEYIAKHFNASIKLDKKCHLKNELDIFYCGDAYDKDDMKLKMSDLKFAWNAGIPFIAPDDLFGSENVLKTLENILEDKLNYPNKTDNKTNNKLFDVLVDNFNYVTDKVVKEDIKKLNKFIASKKYLFIISPPASGKSTFCKKYLEPKGFKRLSKDDYKTVSIYKNTIISEIASGTKVVFDNTNYTEKSRNDFVDLVFKYSNDPVNADDFGYIHRECTKPDSLYLNKLRHFESKGEYNLLPEVAIHKYFKNLAPPVDSNSDNPKRFNELTRSIKISHMIKKGQLSDVYL